MRRHLSHVALVVSLAAVVAGCTDASPTAIAVRPGAAALTQGGWDVEARIEAQIAALFPTGLARSVAARWTNVTRKRASDAAAAEQHLSDLIDWINKKTDEITPPAGMTQAEAAAGLVYLMRRSVYGDPDLAFESDFSLDASEIIAGGSLATSGWTVQNAGGVESRAFQAQFYLVSAAGSVPLSDAISYASVAAGASASHDGVSLVVPAGTAPGTYDVVLKLASENVVEESNEANNASARQLTVVDPVPTSGADIVVFSTIGFFHNDAGKWPGNIRLYQNLVDFRAAGARAASRKVLIHIGHGFGCKTLTLCLIGSASWVGPTRFEQTIMDLGYPMMEGNDETAPLTKIGADVKVIFLFIPHIPYKDDEIESLKKFVLEGGRIVFDGVSETAWRASGIALMNDFLAKIGSNLRNLGGQVGCQTAGASFALSPKSSLREHQVTEGIESILEACGSELQPSGSDQPLIYDWTGKKLMAAATKIR